MTHYDIVKKLIGNITAVGEANEDVRRATNLDDTIDLVDQLLRDILTAAKARHRVEASMKQIGRVAYEFLGDVHAATDTEELP